MVTVPELLKETAAIFDGRRGSAYVVKEAKGWPRQHMGRAISVGRGVSITTGQHVDHRVQPSRAVLHREIKPE